MFVSKRCLWVFVLFFLIVANLTAEPRRIVKRVMQEHEFQRFIEKDGVYEPGRNYNVIIDGHGTGLVPPTMERWLEIKKQPVLIDYIEFDNMAAPVAVDNSKKPWFPPIGDQSGENSCVSWACGYYVKTFQEAREHGWDLSGATWEGGYSGAPTVAYWDRIFSPDFIYHHINRGANVGTSYEDNATLLYRIGCCTWDFMPYDGADYVTWPSEAAYRQAPWYRSATSYSWLPVSSDVGLETLKLMLADENLVVISVASSEYADMTDEIWTTDIYAGTPEDHANTVVGYDDNFGPYEEGGSSNVYGAFKVANSWGKGWNGDNNADGFFWISYECMKLKIEKVLYFENRVAYEPKMVAVFEIDHNNRGENRIDMGIGDTVSPDALKPFDQFTFNSGSHPYPNHPVVFDITEFQSYMSGPPDHFFMQVNDTGSETTGTIEFFNIENYNDYAGGIPTDVYTSVNTPVTTQNNATVYAHIYTDENTIVLDPLYLNIPTTAGDAVFDVYTNTTGPADWSAEIIEGGDWLHITSSASGSGNGEIHVHYDENVAQVSRQGRLRVTASWALNSPQDAVVNCSVKQLELISPNGGEVYDAASNQFISWNTTLSSEIVEIHYSIDNGATWPYFAETSASSGGINWPIPNTPSTACRVRIGALEGAAFDESDEAFTIQAIEPDTLNIIKTTMPPAIDGYEDDAAWEQAELAPLAKFLDSDPDPDDADDLSGYYKALWDDNNFYYLAHITDDVLRNSHADFWQNDDIELYIDADNSKKADGYDTNDDQLYFIYDGNYGSQFGNLNVNNANVVWRQLENGYILELSVPFPDLGFGATEGHVFGWDVQVDDADEEARNHGLRWYTENNYSWANPSIFGEAKLAGIACIPPDWSVDPAEYEYSMTLVGVIEFEGVESTDPDDIIAAFAGDECRGVAQPTEFPSTGRYTFGMTIYSNSASGDTIRFQAFDHSMCTTYGVSETYSFISNSVIGDDTDPEVLHAGSYVLMDIPFVTGWNWFSMNVEAAYMQVDSALASLAPNGNFIKNQTAFATFYGGETGWYSSNGLEVIDPKSMYMIKMNVGDTLLLEGLPVDYLNTPISLTSGWNWIGYLPQTANAINDALADIEPNGNFIKNQTQFANYYGGETKWYSSNGLDEMLPGVGYMLRMDAADELTYATPPEPLAKPEPLVKEKLVADWTPVVHQYGHSMAITGIVQQGANERRDADVVVGAFVGEECRGVSRLVPFPLNGRYEFGMLVYGQADEKINFKVYDIRSGSIGDAENSMIFTVDGIVGDGRNPYVLRVSEGELAVVPADYRLYQNHPNPFNPLTTIAYDLPKECDVRLEIYDVRGQLVRTLQRGEQAAGHYEIVWDSRNDLGLPVGSGLYFYRLTSEAYTRTYKMIFAK